MNISLGAPVFCQGGVEVGNVERLVVAPASLSITHLILTEGGPLNYDVIVPMSSVCEAELQRVYLALDVWQIKEMPEYSELDFVTPPADWKPPPPYTLTEIVFPVERVAEARADQGKLSVGQKVYCIDGRAGAVLELRTRPLSRRVVYVAIGKSDSPSYQAVAPSEWIHSISGNTVVLTCALSQLALSQIAPSRLQDLPQVSTSQKRAATRQ